MPESWGRGGKREAAFFSDRGSFSFCRPALRGGTQASWHDWVSDALDWGSFYSWNVCFFSSCQPRLFHSACPPPPPCCFYPSCLFSVHCDCAPRWSLFPVNEGVESSVFSLIRRLFYPEGLYCYFKWICVFCHSRSNQWINYWFERIKKTILMYAVAGHSLSESSKDCHPLVIWRK